MKTNIFWNFNFEIKTASIMKTMVSETEGKKMAGRGGARQGSGRPKGDRTKSISVRVSLEAFEIYQTWSNKTEVIDRLIKAEGRK